MKYRPYTGLPHMIPWLAETGFGDGSGVEGTVCLPRGRSHRRDVVPVRSVTLLGSLKRRVHGALAGLRALDMLDAESEEVDRILGRVRVGIQ